MEGPKREFGIVGLSTDEMPPSERFYFWNRELSRFLLRVEGNALGSGPYLAQAWMRVLPGLRTGTGRFGPAHFRRTRPIVASDNDDFILTINRSGRFEAAQGKREVTLEEGDAYLLACADPGNYTRVSDGVLTCVRFSAASLVPFVPDLYDRVAQRIPADREALGLLLDYLKAGDRLTLTDSALRQSLIRHTHELLALVFSPTKDLIGAVRDAGLAEGRLASIKREVCRRCLDPELSIATVAGRHGLSLRQVQRLFEREGTTFSEYVLAQRLERARRALTDPRHAERKISDIVFDHGFGDLSHFSKAFRRRYGMPPSQLRQLALRPN